MSYSLPVPTARIRRYGCAVLLSISALVTLTGCEGRTLVDDNPVFAAAPPRRSLVNSSTVATSEQSSETPEPSEIQLTAAASSQAKLEGNSIVAEVNGKPIFVDDLIGSVRLALEADPRMNERQRQDIMRNEIQRRLPGHIEQEIVLQALNRKIPEDRRDTIKESLEPGFQEILTSIKQERELQTDEQLNEMLAAEGLSIALLRESFIRIQMVQGYVSTLAETPATIDRKDLVRYYQEHRDEYTPPETIQWQEIVVRFAKHGGQAGAQQRMKEVVQQLQAGADFGQLAARYSDSLTADKNGDLGQLRRDGLADDELEAALFALPSGGLTKVYVRDDRFEVFRVAEHRYARTIPFEEVQQEIEELLKRQRAEAARSKVIDELRETSVVATIFDSAS